MHNKHTKESALRKVKAKGCHIDDTGSAPIIHVPYGKCIGNGTLGALDYLVKQHRYVVVKK